MTKPANAKIADPKKKHGKHPNSKKTQFKKGQVANPKGAGAHDPFKREVKNITNEILATTIKLTMNSTVKEVAAKLKDPATTLMEATILRSAMDAAENGHFEKFNLILERVVGKAPITINIESPTGSMSPRGPQITEEELKEHINNRLDQIAATK